MTTVDVVYRYGNVPTEAAALALGKLREVYGIRRVEFRQAEKTVTVEYDSTRLTEAVVSQLLRRGGLDIVERVPLYTTPAPAAAAAMAQK
jgi:predicted extracellular nuclease